MQVSPAAHEVLGCLAAFRHCGPHRAPPLRQFTRLTEEAFRGALRELAAAGLVGLEQDDLWITAVGHEEVALAFG